MSTDTALNGAAGARDRTADKTGFRTRESAKKRLVRFLDRPGGRGLLGVVATSVARLNSGEDVAIRYVSGLWTRRIGRHFLPDGPRFEYVYSDFGAWRAEIERREADAREYWLRHYTPKDGDVIVDVGAGRGEDVLTFSRGVGNTGRVIALEADPTSFRYLQNFCRLNRLTNTTTLNVAAMDRPGDVRIGESTSSWTENSVRFGDDAAGSMVQAETIHAICTRLGVREITFLKMNIEGAERYALEGMAEIMARVRQICVACHDFRADQGHGEEFRTRHFVEGLLVRAGFRVESRTTDPRDYVRDHVFGLRSGFECS